MEQHNILSETHEHSRILLTQIIGSFLHPMIISQPADRIWKTEKGPLIRSLQWISAQKLKDTILKRTMLLATVVWEARESYMMKDHQTCPHYNASSIFNSSPLITSIGFVVIWEWNCCQTWREKISWESYDLNILLKYHMPRIWDSLKENMRSCSTFSSLWYNSSRVSNICNIKVVAYQNCCWSCWAIIAECLLFRIQKVFVGLPICFTCGFVIVIR